MFSFMSDSTRAFSIATKAAWLFFGVRSKSQQFLRPKNVVSLSGRSLYLSRTHTHTGE